MVRVLLVMLSMVASQKCASDKLRGNLRTHPRLIGPHAVAG
jgi:hypothetical protein